MLVAANAQGCLSELLIIVSALVFRIRGSKVPEVKNRQKKPGMSFATRIQISSVSKICGIHMRKSDRALHSRN